MHADGFPDPLLALDRRATGGNAAGQVRHISRAVVHCSLINDCVLHFALAGWPIVARVTGDRHNDRAAGCRSSASSEHIPRFDDARAPGIGRIRRPAGRASA
jgi:hypothetical protein